MKTLLGEVQSPTFLQESRKKALLTGRKCYFKTVENKWEVNGNWHTGQRRNMRCQKRRGHHGICKITNYFLNVFLGDAHLHYQHKLHRKWNLAKGLYPQNYFLRSHFSPSWTLISNSIEDERIFFCNSICRGWLISMGALPFSEEGRVGEWGVYWAGGKVRGRAWKEKREGKLRWGFNKRNKFFM